MPTAERPQPYRAIVSLEQTKRRISLLAVQDPPVFQVRPPVGPSPWFLTADHAGRWLPRTLGSLGLSDQALASHIAWDIGVSGLAEQLAERLDAFLITQTYSRLVIDCNRPPGTPESIVTWSERTPIPGNEHLSRAAAQAREREIFHPYHHRIGREIDVRQQAGQLTLLVALHSFTPRFMGVDRPWHAGVLYHRDARLSRLLLGLLRADEGGWMVGDNEPYSISDDTDYTVLVHGERRAIPHVELEIRQDLIATAAGQAAWAARLARLLGQAAAALSPR
ncbi:MAG: N-formylglutamate amidohydrolase [Pseudomonadota bacterium]|nr:N-formylglutamate amidohydrolase [Gammaproteobacteria bacterium]MDQ3581223.1 N-formylglutamate amidohydrolase [Pseudomonadota bacterium]